MAPREVVTHPLARVTDGVGQVREKCFHAPILSTGSDIPRQVFPRSEDRSRSAEGEPARAAEAVAARAGGGQPETARRADRMTTTPVP